MVGNKVHFARHVFTAVAVRRAEVAKPQLVVAHWDLDTTSFALEMVDVAHFVQETLGDPDRFNVLVVLPGPATSVATPLI